MNIKFDKYNKYKNNKVEYDDIIFDSKKEAKRYAELKLLERTGRIQDLKRQVPFTLIPKICDQNGKCNLVGELQLLADTAYDEELLVPLNVNVIYGGKTLLPFKSNQGLVMIDIEYLKPLGITQYELTFTLRNESIAVKKGMFVMAIIATFDVNRDDDFTEVIKQLYKLNAVSREYEFMKNKNFDDMEGELALEDE